MTVGMVPGASIAGMVFSLVVSFALPIGLFVYAKKKLGAKAAPFLIGCGVFFVMVLMLEAAIHRIVFQLAGEALTGSVILYAVYGGLMAALFEETGRYIAMRFLVKPLDFPNAFMYGAGHGGVEAMLLCGVASINNIASAVMINSGTMSAQLATLDAEKAADTERAEIFLICSIQKSPLRHWSKNRDEEGTFAFCYFFSWLLHPLDVTSCPSVVHQRASTPSRLSTIFWPSSSGIQNRPVVRQSATPESGASTLTPLK